MKILLTVTHIYSASGFRAFVTLANALHRRGHEVAFLINRKRVPVQKRPFYPLDEGIAIHNIQPWLSVSKLQAALAAESGGPRSLRRLFLIVAIWLGKFSKRNFKKRVKRRIRRLRRRSRPHEDSKEWWDGEYGKTVGKLRERITAIDPDVVVAFLPSSFTYVAQALKASDIPFVVANRNSPFKDYTRERFSSSKYDLSLRLQAPQLAALNLVQLEKYREFFPIEVQDKTRVIPNAAESVSDRDVAHPEKEEDPNIIVSVGRLHEQKNQLLLIDAFAQIATRFPTWQVHIIGEGELANTLKQRIEHHELSDQIRLLGQRKDVFRSYSSSKIFAFPSLYEGFSNAHTEAMSHGLPSVGLASCIYMNEMLTKSGGGLLTDGTVKDFAMKLETLMRNPHLRQELGQEARAYVARFELDVIVDQWVSALHEAIEKSKEAEPDLN
jgi:glycosyltransferase involved in cell wall biosynthesis